MTPDPAPRIARGPADLAGQDALLAMSGLEFMRAMLAGHIPLPAMCGTLGYRLHAVDEGEATFRGTPEFAYTNPMGTVHGGWYGTLLDSALGCAVMTRVPQGAFYTTLEFKVNLLRALPLGAEVEVRATCRHAGRSTAVAEGAITGVADGRLYATGSTTCIILRP
ncbi:MAG: thioesterase [Alphaproteobacteria bacterium HGW-Alphaproteobacteria-2]|nr:MAG: thioesterase [Alphaproteobacteria bacterium HGW-Alphaproteobacteria-2]